MTIGNPIKAIVYTVEIYFCKTFAKNKPIEEADKVVTLYDTLFD
jgi:hypothetical protein